MSAPDARLGAVGRRGGRVSATLRRLWPWLAVLAIAVIGPWLFFDWSKGRHSGFVLSLASQMGLMTVFALSYNMQMGQAGLLSFGHAIFLGLGGYFTIHAMNAIDGGALWLPVELLPLVGAFAGLAVAIVIGYVVTKQRGTAYAMITLGIGELVSAAALMFHGFFGGESGVTGNRVLPTSLFGLRYSAGIQVYYLIVVWTAIAVALMLFLTKVPIGRMANACRDNAERAQFVGYDPRMVRFYQVSLSGFFAGIAGALFAINYEIVTYDAVNAVMSANALLMTFIGGVGVFWGPIVGAVLVTLLQSWVSLLSNSWLVYVGTLFIIMVIYAPGGIAGLIMAHRPFWEAGRMSSLVLPYLRIVPTAFVSVLGFVALVELCTFATIGASQGKALQLFHHEIDTASPHAWVVAVALLLGGLMLTRSQSRGFATAWSALAAEAKPGGARP